MHIIGYLTLMAVSAFYEGLGTSVIPNETMPGGWIERKVVEDEKIEIGGLALECIIDIVHEDLVHNERIKGPCHTNDLDLLPTLTVNHLSIHTRTETPLIAPHKATVTSISVIPVLASETVTYHNDLISRTMTTLYGYESPPSLSSSISELGSSVDESLTIPESDSLLFQGADQVDDRAGSSFGKQECVQWLHNVGIDGICAEYEEKETTLDVEGGAVFVLSASMACAGPADSDVDIVEQCPTPPSTPLPNLGPGSAELTVNDSDATFADFEIDPELLACIEELARASLSDAEESSQSDCGKAIPSTADLDSILNAASSWTADAESQPTGYSEITAEDMFLISSILASNIIDDEGQGQVQDQDDDVLSEEEQDFVQQMVNLSLAGGSAEGVTSIDAEEVRGSTAEIQADEDQVGEDLGLSNEEEDFIRNMINLSITGASNETAESAHLIGKEDEDTTIAAGADWSMTLSEFEFYIQDYDPDSE